MKKILSLVLACLMVCTCMFAFASCDGGNKDADESDDSKTSNKTSNATKIVMATNASFPPYEYYDGDKIVGIDAEIAALIAEELGMELEIVDVEFNSIIDGVKTGKYDIGMAGMTVREDRLINVDFSNSYAKGVQAVIVKEGSAITSVDDLLADGATYKVGVQTGTTGAIYCEDDCGSDRVVQYKTGNEAVKALKTGKIDCVVIDNEPAKSYVKANTGLKVLDTKYVEEEYAICVKKGNSELLNKINAALEKYTNDGTIQKIIDKYIPAE